MQALFLIGAAQGLFLAVVLVSRPGRSLPNTLLAGLMLAFSVDLAMAVYHDAPMSARYPALVGLDLPLAFLYGPLLYLYARTLTAGASRLRGVDAWHFAPLLLVSLFLVPFFVRPGPEKLALMEDPSALLQTRALTLINPLKLVHGAVYLGLVLGVLRRHSRRLRDIHSSVEQVRLRWLRNLTVSVVLMLALAVVFYALGGRSGGFGMDPSALYDDLTLLAVTAFIYAIGYLGLRQPAITAAPVATEPGAGSGAAGPGAAGPEGASPSRVPYARSGMKPEEAARQRDRLVALMEAEHPYRRSDLTLQDLAEALGVTPHNLTEVLSTQLDQRFYDFVNGYRVREVQARLADPAFAAWTVLAIGMEAGFSAKSSFNAVFKRHTGMTPSQYRRQQAEAT